MSRPDTFRQPVQKMLEGGESVDAIVSYLKGQGCSKTDCMWVLEDHANMSHEEAKHAVHFAPAWQDQRAGDEALHDKLENDLRDIARERGAGRFELP